MQKAKKVLFSIAWLLMAFPAKAQWNVSNYSGTKLATTPIIDIIKTVTYWLLAIIGFLAIIAFVVSGMRYFSAAYTGDEDKAEDAKKAMINSIIGVVVALIGLIVIYTVDAFLKGGSVTTSAPKAM